MKKIFLICFICLVVTGCSIEYNLNFEDEQLKEDIKVKLIGADYTLDKINSLKGYQLLAISKGLEQFEYEKDFKELSNEFIMKYHYDYAIDNFYKNNVLGYCYDAFSLISEDDYYLLTTGKNFNCMSFDYQEVSDYKINIKTNHKVLEHNADMVNKNIYTWNIVNNGNDESVIKPIIIKFSKETKKSIWENDMVIAGLVLVAVAIIAGIVFVIARHKNKVNNKI